MSHSTPARRRRERVSAMRPADVPLRALAAAGGWIKSAGRAAKVQANETAMMMSAAATTSVRLISGGFDCENDSWQGATAPSEVTTPPVLLVHGFAGSRSSWASVAQTLCDRGITVDAMSYPPHGTSVDRLAERLIAEVEALLLKTGADRVNLVGHSLGGVVIAHAISDRRLRGKVDTVITLGSPFGGSPWADLLPINEIVRALRRDSTVLRRLASAPLPDGVRWLSMTAALDIVVPGARSVPSYAGVETLRIAGVGHLGILLYPSVIQRIARELAEPRDTGAHRFTPQLSRAS